MSNHLEKIIEAAHNGGEILKKYFGQSLDIKQKTAPADYVTKADLESEDIIIKTLEQYFPDYNIQAEENGFIDKKSNYSFIIDPLDGGNYYVLGIPYFSVMIALMKNNETILAVIHNPILKQTYTAQKNKGAYLGKEKLSVNQKNNLKNINVAIVSSYDNYQTNVVYYAQKLYKEKNVCRTLFNASIGLDLCLLAQGKIEALINSSPELHDYAPGKLIAKEAGAYVTDFQGNPEENDKNHLFLISNGTEIHKELLEILNKK